MLRHLRSPVVSLFACLLVLAASGDDCCLMRAAFPSALASSGPLPLDDPNTDFVEVTDTGDTVAPGISQRERRDRDLPTAALRLSSSERFDATGRTFAGDRLTSHAERINPLRC